MINGKCHHTREKNIFPKISVHTDVLDWVNKINVVFSQAINLNLTLNIFLYSYHPERNFLSKTKLFQDCWIRWEFWFYSSGGGSSCITTILWTSWNFVLCVTFGIRLSINQSVFAYVNDDSNIVSAWLMKRLSCYFHNCLPFTFSLFRTITIICTRTTLMISLYSNNEIISRLAAQQ